MASKYLQKFPVPDNFYEILHDFAREIIRDQPEDILEYGANYFEALQKGKTFTYEGKYNIKRADQKIHKEYNPENQRKKGQESQEISNQVSEHKEHQPENKTRIGNKIGQEISDQVQNKTPTAGHRPSSGQMRSNKMPANQRPQSHHEGSKKDLEKEKETTPTGGQRPSQDQQRVESETSHGTEKAAAHEYMNNLINKSMKSDQLEGSVEYPPDLQEGHEKQEGQEEEPHEELSGEFYVEILNGKNLIAEEAQSETYCVVLLSHNPTTIMKTANSNNAMNPEWKHLDKFVLQIKREEIYDIQLVVQIYNFENGKTLIGESLMEALEIFASPGELKYVTLKLKNSEGAEGNFGEVSLLVSWVPNGEQVPEFKEAFAYF